MNGHDFWYRAHGLGNDYIAVERAALGRDPAAPAVRLLCNRHRGLGSDGVLVRVPSKTADFGVRIYNPDGGEAEKSGNGLRIFAAYLLETGDVEVGSPFSVETKGGIVQLEVLEVKEDGLVEVEVEMGTASFHSGDVGLSGPDREVVGERLDLPDGETVPIHTVSIGNPHCVCFETELSAEVLRRRGPQIISHPSFAHGTNFQLAQIVGPGEVAALVWERGVGETLASGSSACAVAAAAVRRGLVTERTVRVDMPGGNLTVTVGDRWQVVLRGPVEPVARILPTPGFLRRVEALS
jgi:diaminopimelate epimerase